MCERGIVPMFHIIWTGVDTERLIGRVVGTQSNRKASMSCVPRFYATMTIVVTHWCKTLLPTNGSPLDSY